MSDQKYYIYKLMVDSGGAPCVYRNVLSLAICKPAIRSTCGEGDWILGFGSKNRLSERLIYIAEITKKYSDGDYYREKRLQSRPDNIYRWTQDGHLVWKKGALFHAGGNPPDIGIYPGYKRAHVLMSNDFRYFGDKGTDFYKGKYPNLTESIEKLTQGHRLHHTNRLVSDIERLIKWVWKKYPEKVLGSPSDGDKSANCSKCEGVVAIC